MEKNMENLISGLNYNNLILIKEACEHVKLNVEKFRQISDFCDGVLGENISNYKSSSSELFVLSIKDAANKELIYIRDLFNKAFGITRKMEYKMICNQITLILEFRKKMLLSTLGRVDNMYTEELDMYLKTMPIDTKEKLAEICEIGIEELSPKVLTKTYYDSLDLGREYYE